MFNRIADASNIEFEKLIYNKGGHRVADIATTGDESTTYYGVTFADNHVKNGFIVESWDHNHPGGTPPSGHNRKTGLPIEDIFGRFFGDADFARHKKESGNYDNTQFFVTPKCQNIKYQFDGKNQYKKISR